MTPTVHSNRKNNPLIELDPKVKVFFVVQVLLLLQQQFLEFVEYLEDLMKRVHIHYIPAHNQQLSNEIADQLCKGQMDFLKQPTVGDLPFYTLRVMDNTVSFTTLEGNNGKCSLSEWENKGRTAVAEELYLDNTIFWKDVNHLLLPWSKKRKLPAQCNRNIQKLVHLPVDDNGNLTENAKLSPRTKSLVFGCQSLPENIIGIALKRWMNDPSTLEQIVIGFRDPLKNRHEKMRHINKHWLANEMIHIWKYTNHGNSLFAEAELTSFKKDKEDFADMYLLYSNSGTHMAVVSVSDLSISIHCGFKHGKFVASVLKQAFEFVTGIADDYYSIIEKRIPQPPALHF